VHDNPAAMVYRKHSQQAVGIFGVFAANVAPEPPHGTEREDHQLLLELVCVFAAEDRAEDTRDLVLVVHVNVDRVSLTAGTAPLGEIG
jgi:hypothetical protein